MKSVITLAIGGCRVVKYMTLYPKSKGSNSIPGTKREPLVAGERKWQKAS
jgi:hypothetical protein